MKRSLFLLVAIIYVVGMIAISGCKKDEDSSVEIHGSQQHEWVDLGLPSGTLWATCNVGANAPEESGDYFAWGETAPKETYTRENYRYYGGVRDNEPWYTKYNTEDNLLTLLPTDDAATVNWGNGWRMPTETEYIELCSNCTLTLATINGVDGVRYTGTNGNFIFLPSICGYTDERNCIDGNHFIWTSTRYPNYDGATFHYVFYYGEECYGSCEHDGRRVGMPVRPVVAQ